LSNFSRGYAFNSTADFELVRNIKESLCYVSSDINVDRKLANETTSIEKEYQLPDKSFIKIGRERFEAAELIFNPQFDGNSFDGVSNLVFDTIQVFQIIPLSNSPFIYINIFLSLLDTFRNVTWIWEKICTRIYWFQEEQQCSLVSLLDSKMMWFACMRRISSEIPSDTKTPVSKLKSL